MAYAPTECATTLPRRSSYEGAGGGWTDGRLGQAYDLIAAVREQQHPEHEITRMLTSLLGEMEDADIEIGVTA